jgi:hypothetical protein
LPNIQHLDFLSSKSNRHKTICCYFLSYICLGCV